MNAGTAPRGLLSAVPSWTGPLTLAKALRWKNTVSTAGHVIGVDFRALYIDKEDNKKRRG